MTQNRVIDNSAKYSFRVSKRNYSSEEERKKQYAIALKKLTNVISTDVLESDSTRKGN
jgi:hypothetical protein